MHKIHREGELRQVNVTLADKLDCLAVNILQIEQSHDKMSET